MNNNNRGCAYIQLADRFISDPNEIVKLHQHVKVIEVDISRNRIQLSMKEVAPN